MTEADLHADEAARAEASKAPKTNESANWRTRLAREQAWEEARQTESDDPGEGPTFLPRG